MDSVLNAAFIGCGAIAQKKHLPLAKKDSRLHIKKLYNRSKNAADACKEEFGSDDTVVAECVEEIWDDDNIDIVFIGTPNDTHAEYSIDALKSGKHVICEKPMAITSSDAKKMIDASRKYGKMLHISYQNHYTNQAQYAKRLFEEGVISDIYYAKAYAIRRRAFPTWGAAGDKAVQGGGPLMDIGSHAIDLALWLTGNVRPVYAAGTAHHQLVKRGSEANLWGNWDSEKIETEDLALGFVVMENGMTLSVEASYALNVEEEKEASLDLFGANAGLKLREKDGVTFIHEMGGKMCITTNEIQESYRSLTPKDCTMSASEREHEEFMKQLMDGKIYDPTVEEAYVTAQIVEGIYRSAEQGKPIYF